MLNGKFLPLSKQIRTCLELHRIVRLFRFVTIGDISKAVVPKGLGSTL